MGRRSKQWRLYAAESSLNRSGLSSVKRHQLRVRVSQARRDLKNYWGDRRPVQGSNFKNDGTVPRGYGEFGHPIEGAYGPRYPGGRLYDIRSNDHTFRFFARSELVDVEVKDYLNSDLQLRQSDFFSVVPKRGLDPSRRQQYQDAIDAAWIFSEARLNHLRDQEFLYRNTDLEKIINREIRLERGWQLRLEAIQRQLDEP